MPWRSAIVALALSLTGQSAAGVRLTSGMVIDRSLTIRPGTYRLVAAPDLSRPAVIIRGDNITVDFNGAVLAGGPDDADPDRFAGVGVLIAGGQNVTVKNATIRGYKIAILARRSPNLRLTDNNLSYNWKPRLYSGVEKESLVDWMSYHQNDKDEWLARGAAIYLADCDRARIERNVVLQGQNGVMVARSSGLEIVNNSIQFMSGIGVGFYRTTDSSILHNRIDWCVRGYSHGFYNRGQDSAGLLMYEQSSRNTVAHNSITHGGDGLFLWAGQSTMDTGQGGSNDNRFEWNDFSHAATNGIEATFSRNSFIGNRVEDCWHGVWGGYSYKSVWARNRFARNGEAIAIEHGQDNVIQSNSFDGDGIGIRLWQNATQDPNWGYPKTRDTRSRGYVLSANTFRKTATALDIRATADVQAPANRFESVTTRLAGDVDLALDTPPALDIPPAVLESPDAVAPPSTPDGIDPMIHDERLRGRHRIIVDEWGPYDWKSPKLWPAGRSDASPLTLRTLGPDGRWKLVSSRGAQVSPRAGRMSSDLVVTASTASPVDFTVTLEYRGDEVISPRGAVTPAGQPYTFSYSRFFMPIAWTVKFFAYDDGSDPVKAADGFRARLAAAPIRTIAVDRLDYLSGRALEEGLPRDRFALVAEGTAALPHGDYILQVISDDGVRVWMDDRKILDEWTPHESKVSRVPIRGGRRRFKVEYYEIGGFAELRFDIQRK
ncbi:MAG TPA: right-handed parallel beta-helix repeat-containing protein [Vicinamibacterales bacterium]|nr:right-handed parallel beta-helix repeat-containing protein [Vicinamibacterales bacterium]